MTLSYTTGIYCDERFLEATPQEYDGKIWCLTTEHGNFYIENDGCSFWTGNCDAKIHMDRASHIITKLWMEGKIVYGRIEVINDDRSPCGSLLSCYIDRKIQVGVSSRGVGDMEIVMHEGEDCYEVQPGYAIITFDTVAEPSVRDAKLKRLNESLQKRISPKQLREMREKLLLQEINKSLQA